MDEVKFGFRGRYLYLALGTWNLSRVRAVMTIDPISKTPDNGAADVRRSEVIDSHKIAREMRNAVANKPIA